MLVKEPGRWRRLGRSAGCSGGFFEGSKVERAPGWAVARLASWIKEWASWVSSYRCHEQRHSRVFCLHPWQPDAARKPDAANEWTMTACSGDARTEKGRLRAVPAAAAVP